MAVVTDNVQTVSASTILECFTVPPDMVEPPPSLAVIVPEPERITRGNDLSPTMLAVEKQAKIGKLITMSDADLGCLLSQILSIRAAYHDPNVTLPDPDDRSISMSAKRVINLIWNKSEESKKGADKARRALNWKIKG